MIIINTDISQLTIKINLLRALKTQCESIDVSTRQVAGSGDTNAQLQRLDAEYGQIKEAMVVLLENSIEFFENVRQSMMEADDKAAGKFIAGGEFQ